MNGYRRFKFAKVAILVPLALGAIGFIVMRLWNWLLPGIFGLPAIDFWKALGLLVLSRILFGGMRGPGHGGARWRAHWQERFEQMTPEERDKFRHGLRGRCPIRDRSMDSTSPNP